MPRLFPKPSPDYEILIIDGFSLLYRDPESLDLLQRGRLLPARRRLVEKIERINGVLADRIIVVFDGRAEGGPGEDFLDSQIEVLYSPGHQSADLVIERLVQKSARPNRILVVSSDRMVRDGVDAGGAQHIGCTDFLERIRQTEQHLKKAASGARTRAPANRLDDWFPKP